MTDIKTFLAGNSVKQFMITFFDGKEQWAWDGGGVINLSKNSLEHAEAPMPIMKEKVEDEWRKALSFASRKRWEIDIVPFPV